MKMRSFLRDCNGAVTIDWVTLTSTVLLVGIMVVYSIYNNGVSSLTSSVNSTLRTNGADANIGNLENQNP